MHFKFIILLHILCIFCLKTSYSLTQSLGQEVIEIGAPIKEVPDLEEEPSAENEDDKVTSTTIQVATKKEIKKYSPNPKKAKDADKIYGKKQEEEEARIEKELADIYRDSVDYKGDSAEVTTSVKENVTDEENKPIARARTNFKFQPDSNNPKEVAKFRTSIDEISCSKSKLSGVTKQPSSGERNTVQDFLFLSVVLLCILK